jgi:T5SS/PEP-CTERM-associated repeat protein
MKFAWLAPALALALFATRTLGESFTTNIIDGVSTNAGPLVTVGATGPYNFLLITNGARLTNGTSIVGDAEGADYNSALVTGTNSTWESTNNLIVGNTGRINQTSVLNGGTVRAGLVEIGWNESSFSNSVEVAGYSSMVSAGFVRVGRSGSGNSLLIHDGGRVDSSGSLGSLESATGNFAVVRDAGSLWQAPILNLGFSGQFNYIQVIDGADLWSNEAYIGKLNTASYNAAFISGSGSSWYVDQQLTIGSEGPNGSLHLADGAQLTANSITVGYNSVGNALSFENATLIQNRFGRLTIGDQTNAYSNVVVFDGPNARGSNTLVTVGNLGSFSRLVLQNSAQLDVAIGGYDPPHLYVGVGIASHGNSVEVLSGSKLRVNALFRVGDDGFDNSLLVNDADLRTQQAQIGSNCWSHNNHVLITGPTALWTNGTLELGFCGASNTLAVSNGA